ncbi:MAG: preprotein translocase subunit YajC [Deltaproteobacteria bacterium]|nr:MAG: preprotein translocase subunit YajC [Deltaproteobacteria bacterium]
MSGLLAVITLQAQRPASGFLDLVVLLVPLFLIFYLFLIRPQQRRQREHEDMLKAITKGDTAVTAGGLHGKVVGVSDESLTLELPTVRGDKVRLKVDRSRIERRIEGDKKEKAG